MIISANGSGGALFSWHANFVYSAMGIICYHASHEQFSPGHLLRLVQLAEAAGFEGIHSSDHFHPWSVRQGNSGFSFSWLGAAMHATSVPYSVICAPGQRYHPAIVAQAAATLTEMFPDRFTLELGSGEAINECITGDRWPDKHLRNERLKECAVVIRDLLNGKKVSHRGLITVQEARLYSLPKQSPRIFCAAISEATAAWAGDWADGLLTTGGDLTALQKKINLFRSKAGSEKPFFVQYSFTYHPDRDQALAGALHQWRSNMVGMKELEGLHRVEDFDRATEKITKEQVAENVEIFTDMQALKEKARQYLQMGAERVILHNINREQEQFISDFGKAS
ncbi:TIGR03885 family FMN-dependent LLM class oxidoreductase [Flavihumibacter petaseus]|uniref:F420-dependent oxidoreductase n=1 Tax=Flavihumibacter petaseus NBRC 106054 TaxID=1220578 RepID=A0A0E9MWT6_9BACT|nr:TIGR03885 family FMN-dependent LLM class oxidoreductase [Flavihumibacter petaseus]GAO41580.1 F420-dependent oxidoreductase [Flavihumibacter petaseus NBRC 106054]